MSEHDLEKLAQLIAEKTKGNHVCVFDEDEIKYLQTFMSLITGENLLNLKAAIDFGSTLRLFRKTTSTAAFNTLVLGLIALIVWGIKSWITRATGAPTP